MRNKKIKFQNAALVIFFVLLICNNTNGQNLNLTEAIDFAIQNNKQLKNEQLKIDFANAIISTAKEMPKTNVYTELGQINSNLFDTKFGIAQNIPSPSIYKTQKQIYEIDYSIAKASIILKEYDLKKAIADLYYQYQFLKEKEELLKSTDTIFTIFFNKALLRLQKGESNILEKATAENQKSNIELQLKMLQQEIDILLVQFQYLLNKKDAKPQIEKNFIGASVDTATISKHPLFAIYSDEIRLAFANTALEKAKLKPDFNVGLNNSSFRGVASNNTLYKGLDRFTSVQLGIAIPIFAKNQKAKIKAFRINENIMMRNLNIAQEKLQLEFEKWLTIYKSNREMLNTYNANVLKNAILIKQVANKQFINGEINYLDFVMLIHQAIQIENNYIDAKHAVNNSILHLNYITIQK